MPKEVSKKGKPLDQSSGTKKSIAKSRSVSESKTERSGMEASRSVRGKVLTWRLEEDAHAGSQAFYGLCGNSPNLECP